MSASVRYHCTRLVCLMLRCKDSLEVFDADGRLAGCYMTYRHMREREAGCNLRALGVTDILVTGEVRMLLDSGSSR